jgi:hypothetical protein
MAVVAAVTAAATTKVTGLTFLKRVAATNTVARANA